MSLYGFDNEGKYQGVTCLYLAIRRGHELALQLLDREADPNSMSISNVCGVKPFDNLTRFIYRFCSERVLKKKLYPTPVVFNGALHLG